MFNTIDKEKKITVLFGVLGFFLIIIFLSTFISYFDQNVVVKIPINNLSSVLPNISKTEEESLEIELFSAISQNTPDNITIKSTAANIIQDSYEKIELDTYTHIRFLVKPDYLDQEYLIQYNDGEGYGGYKILAQCYSSCLVSGNSQDSLKYVLPYSSTTSNTSWTLRKGEYFSPKNTDLIVYIDSCLKDFDTTNIETDIQNFLANYNISDYKLNKAFSCGSEY